jgi:cytochrome b involved in lipid metabolism
LGSIFGLCYELNHPPENEIQKARYQVGERKLKLLGETISWPANPLKYMNWKEICDEIESGKKLLIVGDRVCDVDKFQTMHPGGQALILSMVGKDPQSTKKLMQTRHTHTKAARNLMENLTVAFYRE